MNAFDARPFAIAKEMTDCAVQKKLSWQGKRLLDELLSNARNTSMGLQFLCSEKAAWRVGLKPRSYALAISELVTAGFIRLGGITNGVDYFHAADGWRENKNTPGGKE